MRGGCAHSACLHLHGCSLQRACNLAGVGSLALRCIAVVSSYGVCMCVFVCARVHVCMSVCAALLGELWVGNCGRRLGGCEVACQAVLRCGVPPTQLTAPSPVSCCKRAAPVQQSGPKPLPSIASSCWVVQMPVPARTHPRASQSSFPLTTPPPCLSRPRTLHAVHGCPVAPHACG